MRTNMDAIPFRGRGAPSPHQNGRRYACMFIILFVFLAGYLKRILDPMRPHKRQNEPLRARRR